MDQTKQYPVSMKRSIVYCLLTLLSTCVQNPSTISLVDAGKATFRITGQQKLQWIWFKGPYQHEEGPPPPISQDDDPKKIIIWKIAPPGFKDISMDSAPLVTYGVLPDGWEQEIPEDKTQPPALLDGYWYSIGAVPERGAGPKMCIFKKDGQIYPYTGDDELCK